MRETSKNNLVNNGIDLVIEVAETKYTPWKTMVLETKYYSKFSNMVLWMSLFLPEASFGLRVLSLPASVCLCVCPSVHQSWACPRDNSSPVSARITKFGQEM